MSSGALAGLITGATGLVTAVITLVRLLQHKRTHTHKPPIRPKP